MPPRQAVTVGFVAGLFVIGGLMLVPLTLGSPPAPPAPPGGGPPVAPPAPPGGSGPGPSVTPAPPNPAPPNGSLGNGTTGSAPNGSVGGGGLFGALGGFGSWFAGLVSALANPMQTFQNLARQVMTTLVSRPTATQGGNPALFVRPDGSIMGAMWDVTTTLTLPLAILLSALYAGLAEGLGSILPPSVLPRYAASRARWQALGRAPHALLGWPIIVIWAIVCQAVAKALMPTGQQVFPGGQSLVDQAVAGGIGGLILWFSSGVLAILAFLVIVIGIAAAVFGPPAYPLIVGVDPPDLPVLRHFQMAPSEGTLVAAIATPVSTALVLALGYPFINALRSAPNTALVSLAGIPFISLATVVMWAIALLAPLYILVKARQMRPIAMLGAGALGAVGGFAAGRQLGGIPRPNVGGGGSSVGGPGGPTVNPLDGSPFSRSTDGGTHGGGLGSGAGGATAGALGTGGGASASRAAAGATPTSATDGGGAVGAATGGGGQSTGTAGGGGGGPSASEQVITDWGELPDHQQYEVGVETDLGGWQTVQDSTHSHEWLTGGAFEKMSGAYDESLRIRGVQDGQTYDPTGRRS